MTTEWPELRLRSVAIQAQTGPFGSQLHAEEYIENGIPLINPSNIRGGKLLPDPRVSVAETTAMRLSRHRLAAGDLIFARRGELGRSAVVSKEAAGWLCGTGSLRVTLRKEMVDPQFAGYVLQSRPTRRYFETQAIGSTMENLNTSIVLGLPLPCPPILEQRRIANFLDVETRKIDTLVSKKTGLLCLLEQRIDNRILEYVGLSPLVGDSDSTIPALPIHRLLAKLVRPAAPVEDVITAYRDGQVTARSKRRVDGYALSSDAEAQGQYVEVGDVVIHGLDGFAGAIGTSESVGNCSPVYHVCTPRRGGNSLFLGRLLRVLAIDGYLGLFATSTRERAVDFRNWNIFGRIPIPDVPTQWQDEIGGWISSAQPLRVAVEQSFALAEERRQALITAAVTGQIDVTTVRGVEV